MEIKHTIFRRGKQGASDASSYSKRWTLRFAYRDELGNIRRRTYQFATRNDAVDARPRLEAELRDTLGKSAIGDKMTFRDLAEHAKATFYRPAEIADGRKVAGVKSHRNTHQLIDTLVEYFGKKKLASITRSDMDGFKAWRIKQGDRRGRWRDMKPNERKPVSLSTVNRTLAIFKRMMKYAHAENWIARDVTLGSKAIDPDAEKARMRLLKADEEVRLLSACNGTRALNYERNGKVISAVTTQNNPYLKAVILFGLDSGLRRNEVLTLEWKDIDLVNRNIIVQSRNTKTQQEREIPLSSRLKDELEQLPNFGEKGRVFPFADFKRSFGTALRVAGIEDLSYHDLRRTWVTRLILKNVPIAIVAKLAGHRSLATTQKHYVSIEDPAIIDEVRAIMDSPRDMVDLVNEMVN